VKIRRISDIKLDGKKVFADAVREMLPDVQAVLFPIV